MSEMIPDAEAGRLVGVVARKARGLYQRIKMYADAEGKKIGEVLVEALEIYDLYKQLENVDPKCILAAIRIINAIEEMAVRKLVWYGQLFTSDWFQAQWDILNELKELRTAPTQQKQKQQLPPEAQKMLSTLVTTLTNLLLSMLANMFGIKMQIPMQEFGKKPVNIKIVESE